MSPDAEFLPSPRVLYYNPKLDPYVIANKMTPEMAAAVEECRYDNGSERLCGPLLAPDAGHPFNLVSSLCADGLHRPALDVDFRDHLNSVVSVIADVVDAVPELDLGRLVAVPSTRHWHVYIPELALQWADYTALLDELVMFGVLERAYVDASLMREAKPCSVPRTSRRSPPLVRR